MCCITYVTYVVGICLIYSSLISGSCAYVRQIPPACIVYIKHTLIVCTRVPVYFRKVVHRNRFNVNLMNTVHSVLHNKPNDILIIAMKVNTYFKLPPLCI